jgi:hypothetical protein
VGHRARIGSEQAEPEQGSGWPEQAIADRAFAEKRSRVM